MHTKIIDDRRFADNILAILFIIILNRSFISVLFVIIITTRNINYFI